MSSCIMGQERMHGENGTRADGFWTQCAYLLFCAIKPKVAEAYNALATLSVKNARARRRFCSPCEETHAPQKLRRPPALCRHCALLLVANISKEPAKPGAD